MDESTIWLKAPQNLKSLEIEQKWLVSNYGKICAVNSFFVLLFSLFIFLGGNYLCKQFFTSKFIILFSYNGIAPLIFCFDLISTKNSSTYYFFLLSHFYRTFNTFYTFNFERNLIILFPKRIILHHFLLKQHLQQCSNGK